MGPPTRGSAAHQPRAEGSIPYGELFGRMGRRKRGQVHIPKNSRESCQCLGIERRGASREFNSPNAARSSQPSWFVRGFLMDTHAHRGLWAGRRGHPRWSCFSTRSGIAFGATGVVGGCGPGVGGVALDQRPTSDIPVWGRSCRDPGIAGRRLSVLGTGAVFHGEGFSLGIF